MGCGCLQLFWDKGLLVVSEVRFASGIWANHKIKEEVKLSTVIPYSLLHRKGSIPCPRSGKKKSRKRGGFESSCSYSHAGCRSLQAHSRLPSSGAVLTHWFIQRASSRDWMRPTAELPLVEQLTPSLERWVTCVQCMLSDW